MMTSLPSPFRFLTFITLTWLGLTIASLAAESESDTTSDRLITEQSISDETAKIVAAYADMSWFSGTIVLRYQGRPIYQQAVGLADRGQSTPNRLNTKFNLGSIAKNFTAVLALQMIEQGKLNLNDTLSQFHLGFSPDIADKITVEHLLTHTSGFGDIFTAEYQSNRLSYDSLAKKLTLLLDEPLRFEPGSKSRYSNYGYIVLGVILEQISGKSFGELLRQNIIAPLDLKCTRFRPQPADDEQSLRYTLKYDGTLEFVGITEHPGPDGGIEANAGDLAQFYEHLFNSNQLLSEEGRATFKRLGKKTDYWRAFGGGLGISSAYEVDLATGYSVTVLANTDKLVAEIISGRIMAFIQTGRYARIKQQVNVFAYQLYQRLGPIPFREQFAASYTAAGYDGFNGRVINEVGMQLVAEAQYDQANDFFLTLVHLYPQAPQAYDSLAWGYAQEGKNELAWATFAQALNLKPDFQSDYSIDNYESLRALNSVNVQ